MTCSFKLDHYADILTKALKKGYVFTTFENYKWRADSKKLIILRHDIDLRIDRALELAKIEKDLNIRSTFFVRLHAKQYNPFEYKAYQILRQIRDWGFEIGLHFEALDVKRISEQEWEIDIFRKEKEVLERILDLIIVTAVQHGDFTGLGDYFFDKYKKEDVDIYNDPFEDRFFKDMKYLSDSYGRWRDGCPCQHIGKVNRLQISAHPCYWYREFYHTE